MALQILEIRTYRLLPDTREKFHRLAAESIGALGRYGITVVDYGPSLVGEDGREDYYLMRTFQSLAQRERLEAAFYGGQEWRHRWRDEILACVESFHTIVFKVTPEAVAGLMRRG